MTDIKPVPRLITRALVITVTANVMGPLQFGFNAGMPSNTQDIIHDFMNRTIFEREGSYPSEKLLANLWALIAAIYFFGGSIGGIINKWMSGKTSRKTNLLLIILLGVVSAALMFLSKIANRWELLLVGRFLIGVHAGLYSALVPVYLSEISPKAIRGAISNFYPIGIVTAVLIAQVCGLPELLGTDDRWHILYGLTIVPCLIQLLLLPFCVESPRYLMISKKNKEAARHALQILRQASNVDGEMDEMQEEIDKAKKTVSFLQLFQHPPYRRATTLATLAHLTVQLCGVNAVIIYSTYIFQNAVGLSREIATHLTVAYGAVSVLVTIIGTPLTEKTGRRKLQLIGLGGLIFCTAMITISLTTEKFRITSVGFLQLFVVFFNIGPGRIPWILVGELFAQEARPAALSLAVLCNWSGGFVIVYAFSPLERILGVYVFLPFCAYNICMIIYTYLTLPETKGKTIKEITDMFETK